MSETLDCPICGYKMPAHERVCWIGSIVAEYTALRAENEALMGTLDQINTMACYASEENTSLRPQALLEIGKLARAALAATEKKP